jgi:chromosome segregation ATPase
MTSGKGKGREIVEEARSELEAVETKERHGTIRLERELSSHFEVLEVEIRHLKAEVQHLKTKNEKLEAEVQHLMTKNEKLEAEVQHLKTKNEKLEAEVDLRSRGTKSHASF